MKRSLVNAALLLAVMLAVPTPLIAAQTLPAGSVVKSIASGVCQTQRYGSHANTPLFLNMTIIRPYTLTSSPPVL
ncbi:MAG: hypothetical protein NXY59_09305 [Aigarchaeota archaeon]|nr:hypothetical protein [Candidatus Pelearchaeum maunauluense]